jgi:hypothetical protein
LRILRREEKRKEEKNREEKNREEKNREEKNCDTIMEWWIGWSSSAWSRAGREEGRRERGWNEI